IRSCGECVTETSGDVTSLLLDWNGGNRAALDTLLPLVYRELRQMARRYMLSENRGHTLQPTAFRFALTSGCNLPSIRFRRCSFQPLSAKSSEKIFFIYSVGVVSLVFRMESYETVYRRHCNVVLRFAIQCIGRRDIAEELTAEAFLELHR